MQKLLVIIVRYLLPVIVVGWSAVLLAQKIDLPVADIGRHIKNGEIILNSPWAEKWSVLHRNYYSYTEPNHEFINHHWLSGVIFYFIHRVAGFEGLSVFYIAMVSLAFLMFYLIAEKRTGSVIAGILAILVLPIITSRAEIRPEGFTYLFMGIFYWITQNYTEFNRKPHGNYKWLFLLPVLMMLWVNLHIGFIFGFLILGAFWLEELIKALLFVFRFRGDKSGSRIEVRDDRLRRLTITGILCLIAGLINPFFIKGLLYPLNIFRQYGYMIVENQSVRFLEGLGMGMGLYFGLFKFLLILAGASFVARFIFSVIRKRVMMPDTSNTATEHKFDAVDSPLKHRMFKKGGMIKSGFPYHEFLLLTTVGSLSFLAIRNFPVFGLLFLPITAANIKSVLPQAKHLAYRLLSAVVLVAVLTGGSIKFWESARQKQGSFGVGLMPGVERAAEFFKANGIEGPIFNNYDIGGYLIYELFKPENYPWRRNNFAEAGWRVFTDNRPEAYSVGHFRQEYIPAQQDEVKWKALDEKYNFNAIFFSHRDYTPWGQAFLISRVSDPNWAPVFADEYSLILVKKNSRNAEIIKKYLLPPENFRVISD